MTEHWQFLKESDHSFGLFYPMHYTIAVFETIEMAQAARERFLSSGFPADDVAAVSGAFVLNHLENEHQLHWFGRLEAQVARIIGSEANFLANDAYLAHLGGAFLFVYTPTHAKAEQARDLIRSAHPMAARRYHRAGVESICYPSRQSLS
ncbi:MAG TPA: hypothetical protein VF271_01450 [Rhodanobacteraceae bacterium]